MPVSPDTCDRHFAVNSRAPALLIAEFARRHCARGASWGRIISLTTGGAPGFPGEVSYGASKNAVESYTVAAAAELAPLGITTNVLSPPPTDTGWISTEVAAELAQATPPFRIAQPDEVAEVIVFLASHQARSINGQRIATISPAASRASSWKPILPTHPSRGTSTASACSGKSPPMARRTSTISMAMAIPWRSLTPRPAW